MRNYSKVGNRPGRPAYRTPADFRIRQALKTARTRLKARSTPKRSRLEQGKKPWK